MTYATDGNTWTSSEDDKVTIDYIFAMGRGRPNSSIYKLDVDFKDVQVKDLITMTSNVSLSDHDSVTAKIKLGCNII